MKNPPVGLDSKMRYAEPSSSTNCPISRLSSFSGRKLFR
jgi:hypothetical protein